MSEWMRGSRGACDRYAPTLALLDDPSVAIDPAERAAALEHLAGCVLCQADQAADARMDAALSRAFGPQAGSPLRTRDLLLAIGATSEPAPHITVTPAPGAANPIRSVVDLGAFEGGFERMSESDEANHAASGAASDETSGAAAPLGAPPRQPAPARKVAAIPSLRPAPRRRPSSRALAMGFSATAAAVILVVVAATLFASRGRAPTHTIAAQHASATATAQAELVATTLGAVYAISMDSPTDGWALGDATPPPPPNTNGSVQPVAALYHYDGTQWTLKQRVAGYPVGFGSSTSLRMFSPTDGWAFGEANTVLRYDGTTWRMERISLSGGAQIDNVFASDIVSPTEGWAIAYISPSSGGVALGFLRLDGSQWTVEQTGIKLPSDLDPQSVQITHMAALPGGDVWATGSANVNVTSSVATATANAGNNPEQRSFLIHRAYGVWTVDEAVSLPANASSVQLNDITMTNATSGWAVGQMTVNMQSIAGGPQLAVQQPLLLRYDGARWTPVQTPPNLNASNGLVSVTASGPANVWVFVGSTGFDINPGGVVVSAIFLHYDGATWSEVQGTFPGVSTASASNTSISAMALGPDGTLWCMGALLISVQNHQGTFDPLIFSYRGGVWSKATIATK
jgi:hypothetical protein